MSPLQKLTTQESIALFFHGLSAIRNQSKNWDKEEKCISSPANKAGQAL